MPSIKRHKTKYVGVYYIEGKSVASGKPERIYYIRYRKNDKAVDEKAGRQFQDDMTPARASRLRAERINGSELSNTERRTEQKKQQWTFNKLWDSFKEQSSMCAESLRNDGHNYKNHIKEIMGEKEPKDISPIDIDRLRINLLKKHKPGTVVKILQVIRKLSNYAENKQLCDGIGFSVKMPKVNNEKTEDLTPEQLKRLIEAIDVDSNIHVKAIMKLALFTGMRKGEILKLKWSDIDYEKGFIHIREPKGGKDQKIPLNDETRDLLQNHPKINELVFPGRNGAIRTNVTIAVNKIKHAAGLPKDFRPLHGLRHVYASMLASSGKVDMYTLQKLLTHKSPIMTQRYAHLRDEALRAASDLAGEIISNAINRKKVVNLDDHR